MTDQFEEQNIENQDTQDLPKSSDDQEVVSDPIEDGYPESIPEIDDNTQALEEEIEEKEKPIVEDEDESTSDTEVSESVPLKKYPKHLPERLRGVYDEMSMTYRFSANTVCSYIEAMGPQSHVTEQSGAAQQKLLFTAVANLLNAPEQEFKKNIQFLFPIFTDHIKGVFSETHIHRFAQFLDLSSQDAKAMPFLFELVRMIADPKSRATTVKHNLGHMPRNLERASSGRGLNEQGRVNLLHFLEL